MEWIIKNTTESKSRKKIKSIGKAFQMRSNKKDSESSLNEGHIGR